MSFYADLHIHSKYSRATSRDCDLEHLSWWAQRKGIAVVATGDFTHPAWWQELEEKLVPAEPGLFRLRPDIEREVATTLPPACHLPTRFLLEVEISTIYKKGEKTRKIHHLIYAGSMATASRFRQRLGSIGNIRSDGRPILGLDSRHLLEITLDSGPDAYLIPAHIWTPWFAALGSKGGFDSIDDCYGDLASHIFAVETGLSSDPPMNWRVSALDRYTLVSNSDAHSPPKLGREACIFDTELDYFAMRRALETRQGFGGTLEFFPEEGKYHLDGHRQCGVVLEPEETRRHEGRCPTCGKPLTVGVLHRVGELADREPGSRPEHPAPFRSLVPLEEVVAELKGTGPKSKKVSGSVAQLVQRLGPELGILETVPLEDLRRQADPLVAEAVERLRAGDVRCQGGYDGEYGVIRLFDPGEIADRAVIAPLFAAPSPTKKPKKANPPVSPPRLPAQKQANLFSDEVPATGSAPAEPPAMPRDLEGTPSKRPPEQAPPTLQEPGTPNPVLLSDRPILEALDPWQRGAASIPRGSMLILAGPGTGKTRTLTHRLAWLVRDQGVPAGSCLALTFTRRAAQELRDRLATLLPADSKPPLVTTFHGLGLEMLRQDPKRFGLPKAFRVLSGGPSEDLQAAALIQAGLGTKRQDRRHLEEARREEVSDPALREAAESYEGLLRQRNLVDFDDLLVLPVRHLEGSRALVERWRERFPWIFVDEYQDMDSTQYRLLRLLAPSGANLTAIGDPDQSIYRFRGADVGLFLRFKEDYPEATVVALSRNYRSTQAIVETAAQVIRPTSLVPNREFVAVRQDGTPTICLVETATERSEAEEVVKTIESLLGGTSHFSMDSARTDGAQDHGLSFDDFAVLYRTEAQASALVEALGRSGIPFQKKSHRRLLEVPAIRRLVSALTADGTGEGERGTILERLEARAVRELEEAPGEESKSKILSALELLGPLASRHGENTASFLDELHLGVDADTWEPRAERVSLITLHAAKGLEFPVVFLVGCEDGLLPFSYPGEQEDKSLQEEERRLFFVGMTRAKSHLYLLYTRQRFRYGEVRPSKPSPFLGSLDPSWVDHKRLSKPAGETTRKPKQLRLL